MTKLSNDLIAQFVKVTNDAQSKPKKESTAYGTIVLYEGKKYVKLDGSELLTPISTTTAIDDGERVMVTIKNHSATVTGNLSEPSAKDSVVGEIGNKISEFEIIIADKVSVKDFDAQVGRIDTLVSDNVLIKDTLTAHEGHFDTLDAENVTIRGELTAQKASIDDLNATKIDASIVEADFIEVNGKIDATTGEFNDLKSNYAQFETTVTSKLTAQDASIKNLETNKLDAESADIKYAKIDFTNIDKATMEYFYATSGLIENVTIGDSTITGNLIGVTIKGDLIEGGTVKADKLVIKGTDGLYYKLNTDGTKIETEQTEYNSINGSVILAKSITATKIDVKDLVAFNATIGGFKISNSSLYSGVKESINNTTPGVYLDKDGQMYIGDDDNYIKYYKDQNGNYHLEITGNSIKLSASDKTIEEAIDSAKNEAITTASNDATEKANTAESNANKYTDDEISTVNQTITDKVAEIKVTTDAITQRVSNTETQITTVSEKVDNLPPDGRNLILDADFSEQKDFGIYTFSNGEVTFSSETGETTANLNRFKMDLTEYGKSIIRNKTVTFSMEYMVTEELVYNAVGSGVEMQLTIIRDDTTGGSKQWLRWIGSDDSLPTAVSSEWTKRTATWVITDYDFISIYCNVIVSDTSGTIKFRNPKLEIGETATEWSLAPEDIESDVKIIDSTLSETTTQVSTLETRADSITASVTEIKTTQESTSEAIDVLNGDLTTLVNSVEAKMSATDVQIAIKNEIANGVSSVTTTTGFTFNQNGLTVSKTGSEMSTNIDEDGMSIYRDTDEVLTANNEGVIAYDLHAKTYLIVGENSRFEDYEKNGKKQTGCFWIGDTEV